jgi:hypothetical protein
MIQPTSWHKTLRTSLGTLKNKVTSEKGSKSDSQKGLGVLPSQDMVSNVDQPMSQPLRRVDFYRYLVDHQKVDLTPLAHIEAFQGSEKIQVLNVSVGGLALLVNEEASYAVGDLLDLSLSIRERPFPARVEIKNKRSKRLSCAFVEPSPLLQQALKEFLKAKYLGTTLRKNIDLSQSLESRELVPGSAALEVYVGENQTGVFVWLDHDRCLKKFLMLSQTWVLEWTPETRLRTGSARVDETLSSEKPDSKGLENKTDTSAQGSESPFDNIEWDRIPSENWVHYFSDILLAWMDLATGTDFVKKLKEDSQGAELRLKFPGGLS